MNKANRKLAVYVNAPQIKEKCKFPSTPYKLSQICLSTHLHIIFSLITYIGKS